MTFTWVLPMQIGAMNGVWSAAYVLEGKKMTGCQQ